MTLKTILAAVSGGTASDGALELACRLALRFGAHVEVFHARPDPLDLISYSSEAFGMSVTSETIDRFVKDADAIVAKTKASFESAIARHQIPTSGTAPYAVAGTGAATAAWYEQTGYGPTLVAGRARFSDLTVLGRSDRVVNQPHTDVVEQTLIRSGRPILLAPTNPPAEVGENVAVGWNGSAEATRAIVGALPFLANAHTVTVLTVGEDQLNSAASLIDYLRWQGIKATLQNAPMVDDASIGTQLLDAAIKANADLLVIGAYGHMPWREFLVGGATRELVSKSLMPLLLSH